MASNRNFPNIQYWLCTDPVGLFSGPVKSKHVRDMSASMHPLQADPSNYDTPFQHVITRLLHAKSPTTIPTPSEAVTPSGSLAHTLVAVRFRVNMSC